jgi:LPXTG-motif cell wall-anchored protein
MKKIFLLFVLITALAASNAFAALQFTLSDNSVNMTAGESNVVTLFAKNRGMPAANVPVYIINICRETAAPSYVCNDGDESAPEFNAILSSNVTDANGNAQITLTHSGQTVGTYHYTVCADPDEAGQRIVCNPAAASVTGDFSIPEFTTIGAGLALAGAAGIYLLRKKK